MTDRRIKMECPFCHCPPKRIQITKMHLPPDMKAYRVKCPDCLATFDTWENKQDAINKWNRR